MSALVKTSLNPTWELAFHIQDDEPNITSHHIISINSVTHDKLGESAALICVLATHTISSSMFVFACVCIYYEVAPLAISKRWVRVWKFVCCHMMNYGHN